MLYFPTFRDIPTFHDFCNKKLKQIILDFGFNLVGIYDMDSVSFTVANIQLVLHYKATIIIHLLTLTVFFEFLHAYNIFF